MTWDGIIPRKRRKSFEQFLHHADPRIRVEAEEMRKVNRGMRELMRETAEPDEHSWEEAYEQVSTRYGGNIPDTEIPF